MKNNLVEFYNHLKTQPLKPVYLISSDVTLLQQEARDALCKTAQKAGFKAQETKFVETGFDWHGFFTQLQNFNLFSDKVNVLLHNPSAKFEEKAVKSLLNYLEAPSTGKLLIILTNKLTSAQQKARWYKTIDKQGLALNIKAVSKNELPNWIENRAKAFKLKLDRQSVLLLAELTEGNLLATQQALQKLRLLYPDKLIDRQKMLDVIIDSARFSVFDLANYALAGKISDAIRCLRGLKNTGTEITLVLWALCRELRELIKLYEQQQQGITLQQALQRQWQSRRALLQQALRRLSLSKLNELLVFAESADLTIKGEIRDNAWDKLEQLVIKLCAQA